MFYALLRYAMYMIDLRTVCRNTCNAQLHISCLADSLSRLRFLRCLPCLLCRLDLPPSTIRFILSPLAVTLGCGLLRLECLLLFLLHLALLAEYIQVRILPLGLSLGRWAFLTFFTFFDFMMSADGGAPSATGGTITPSSNVSLTTPRIGCVGRAGIVGCRSVASPLRSVKKGAGAAADLSNLVAARFADFFADFFSTRRDMYSSMVWFFAAARCAYHAVFSGESLAILRATADWF
jgi:hypothetical protein